MSFKRSVFNLKAATALRSSSELYRRLVHDERLDPDELRLLQDRRSIDHARFAMANTRFYRDRYSAAGFTLKDLEDPAAFAELPIIDKSEVREHYDDIRSTEATDDNSKTSATGGSTSAPLKLLRDLRFPARALEWRLFGWWGVDPSDNIAFVHHLFRSPKESRLHTLQWWPSKRMQLDTYGIDEERVERFILQWEKIRPAAIVGYVGGVVELARLLEARGISLTPPKAIAVTAAPLNQAQRAEIESVFHAPVYDHYRCGEIPWMAGECAERNGLHVFADVRNIEVVDSADRPVAAGTMGEVVVTDLTNRVFPLVRYRLADRTAPIAGVCTCGVTLPRIQAVAGRVSEAARLPDGRVIPGDSLTEIFDNTPDAVRQFQVHQQADYSIIVRCIPGKASDALQSIDRVVGRLRDIVKTVPVTLEVVETIPHDRGKIRYIKSDVVVDDTLDDTTTAVNPS